jgi:gamma-glutamylcyclotransferase (GGCT)/AIG2-like uncharacterized protein YtfP
MTGLYFAYGSNTDLEDWTSFCRQSRFDPGCIRSLGTALLPDARLAFHYYSHGRHGGALDVVDCVGSVVEGVLFQVTPEGWDALDAKEGAPDFYERVSATAILPAGSAAAITTYVVTKDRRGSFVAPAPEYLSIVRRGFAQFRIAPGSLEAAAANRADGGVLRELFIYGTLMRGEALHNAIAAATKDEIRPASTQGTLHDLGAYPALMIPGRSPTDVAGECVTLLDPDSALLELDEIESAAPFGAPGGLYRRTIVEIQTDGLPRRAWAYVMDALSVSSAPVIAGGSWRDRRTSILSGR